MVFIDSIFEAASQSSQALLLAALEQLGEGVIVADAGGALIYVNSAAAAIHGVSELHVKPDDYTTTYSLKTLDVDPYPPKDLPLARTVRHGETIEGARWRILRPDGVLVDAQGTSRPVLDEEGKQIASVLTIADMTEEFAARDELAAALKAKEALLFEVNHRVKNNLALVNSLLALHGRKVTDPVAKAAFEDAAARVSVLVDIHRRLYALGEHQKIEVVDFLVQMTVETVRTLSIEKPVEVHTLQEGRFVLTTEKATTLALALNELILNSLKHAFADTPEPEIRLQIVAENDQLTIKYADNGPGIAETQQQGAKGIGRALVSQLTTALSATYEQHVTTPGFAVDITIPAQSR